MFTVVQNKVKVIFWQVAKREEAVKNVSRELLKANDVIKKLQDQNRKSNQKVNDQVFGNDMSQTENQIKR